MATPRYSTHFVTSDNSDCGTQFVDKDYMISVYPELIPTFKVPRLWSWGANWDGQLGQNKPAKRPDNFNFVTSSPILVNSEATWKQVACGETHSGAIKEDGTLWMWGNNYYGTCGVGTSWPAQTTISSPVQVGSLTDWEQLSCGDQVTFAIKKDGTLWGWGRNNSGDLGLGDNNHRSSPTQVGSLTDWKYVFGGSYNSAAIKNDGTLWTWGANGRGTGLGDNNWRSSPCQVGSLTNWKQIAHGFAGYMMAIKTDGTLWGWGDNSDGEFGNGTLISTNSPVQTGTDTNWKQVTCAFSVTLAVKTDGTLWSWGNPFYGETGQNNWDWNSSPVQVGSLTNWKSVHCFSGCVAAIKTDGTLWTWGLNDGYCGLGFSGDTSSPMQVGTNNNWKQVACGYYHMLAITEGQGY